MNSGKNEILEYNRKAWDAQVAAGNQWTVPVSSQEIANAKNGDWAIVLTPLKTVPHDWFPDFQKRPVEVLCLAGAGGQQGPILAAAGARVTIFDNSPAQLGQDRLVAEREKLDLKTVQGDMADLSCFADETFDLIFHPCSNCFVPDVRPVWNEAGRVLKPGGELLSGFANPIRYLFDDDLLQRGELKVSYSIPYSDLTSLDKEQRARFAAKNEPLAFGHTLADQIGGQISAGLEIVSFFEDAYESDDELSKYIDTYIATRARKRR